MLYNYYDKPKGKYGLTKDGRIVTIVSWTRPDLMEKQYGAIYKDLEQDIYFNFGFIDSIIFKKKTAFTHYDYFIFFSDKKCVLRQQKRFYKQQIKNERHMRKQRIKERRNNG